MLEFSDFVLGPFTSFFISNSLLSVGLIAALLIYFGYFCNLHQVEVEPYTRKVYGMFFLLFYLGTCFYVFYLIFFGFQIIPTSWIVIRSDLWSGLVKFITLLYAILIVIYVFGKSQKCDSKFTYEDVDPSYKNSLKYDEEIQIILYAFKELKPFLLSFPLFVFAYLILLSNTSLITGLFICAHIFLAFTFIAIDKGIDLHSFRYAEIFMKDSKKTEKGRVRSMNSNSLDLLKKKKDGTIFLIEIPMANISKIELRTLEEVLDSPY